MLRNQVVEYVEDVCFKSIKLARLLSNNSGKSVAANSSQNVERTVFRVCKDD